MDSPFRRRRGLSGLISLAGLAVAALSIAPAGAQQVIAGKGSVTIDLGVLNQLGPPVTGGNQPYGQAATQPQAIYGQPANNNTGQTYGGLQFPPQQYPVSTLMVQPPVGSTPYVPPAATASVPPAPASTATTGATAHNCSMIPGLPTSPAWIIRSDPFSAVNASGRKRPWVSEISPIIAASPTVRS